MRSICGEMACTMTERTRMPQDANLAEYRRGILESDLQAAVIDLAHSLGYLVHHDRPAKTANGWRTAITGTPGFPDCVFVRDDAPEVGWTPRVLFVELKALVAASVNIRTLWLATLRSAGAEVVLLVSQGLA